MKTITQIAEQRAQVRMQRMHELDATIEEMMEAAETAARKKFKDTDKIVEEFTSALEEDEDFMNTRDLYLSLEKGGCGDIEQTVCTTTGASYNVETCKACQEKFITLRDAELDKQKKEEIKRELRSTECSKGFVVREYDKLFADFKKIHREALPTLLQNIKE
jgi:hypothetical protein